MQDGQAAPVRTLQTTTPWRPRSSGAWGGTEGDSEGDSEGGSEGGSEGDTEGGSEGDSEGGTLRLWGY